MPTTPPRVLLLLLRTVATTTLLLCAAASAVATSAVASAAAADAPPPPPPPLRCWQTVPKPLPPPPPPLDTGSRTGASAAAAAACPVSDPYAQRVMLRDAYVGAKPDGTPPPLVMPAHLAPYYTRCGSIAVADRLYYVDDSERGQGTHYTYSAADVDALIAGARRTLALPPGAGGRDAWFLQALRAYPVTGLRVVVMGSTSPWVEALLLAQGARWVLTVDYNRLTYDWPELVANNGTGDSSTTPRGVRRLRTVQPHELRAALGDERADAVVSLSSFDHDGLGRYGDPLSPDADLLAMDCAASLLQQPPRADGLGLLYLTVPVGPDTVVWNLHRRYGAHRLPLLLRGWEYARSDRVAFGWERERLSARAPVAQSYEPVFVLRVARDHHNLHTPPPPSPPNAADTAAPAPAPAAAPTSAPAPASVPPTPTRDEL